MSELTLVLVGLMVTIMAGLFGQDYFKEKEIKKVEKIYED